MFGSFFGVLFSMSSRKTHDIQKNRTDKMSFRKDFFGKYIDCNLSLFFLPKDDKKAADNFLVTDLKRKY